MNKMDWALWGLDYLAKSRRAIGDDFRSAMEDLRGYNAGHRESWYGSCKNIILTLYHYSEEFADSTVIPNEKFASPDVFDTELTTYRKFVQGMVDELEREEQKFQAVHKVDGSPSLINVTRRQVMSIAAAIDYVQSQKPSVTAVLPQKTEVQIILALATRFHEAVLSLRKHPHGGAVFSVKDEWDCQYLFRAMLAGYIADIRDEEWNPSVAGSSARCEFFLKSNNSMIELKYVRHPNDAKKIKAELATDFVDYGSNGEVDRVICLVYDPNHALQNPNGLRKDLSGPKAGLSQVDIIISPPRPD